MDGISTDATDHLQTDQIDGLVAAAGIDGAREILEAFRRSTDELLEALSAQIRRRDFGAAMASAHAVKGSAANVGACRLARSAAELETACKQASGDGAEHLLEDVRRDYTAARRCFDEHLANA